VVAETQKEAPRVFPLISEFIFFRSMPHANPGPLGLLAFGMTTTLLNFRNLGIFKLNTMIIGMGICYGGLAQIIVGGWEFHLGNTFGGVAFSSYGFFWLSICVLWAFPSVGAIESSTPLAMVFYLFMWGTFTLFMFFVTLKINRALQVVFSTLVALFYLLGIGDAVKAAGALEAGEVVEKIAGAVGVVCGLSAFYTGVAEVINEKYGRTILPICPVGPKKSSPPVGSAPIPISTTPDEDSGLLAHRSTPAPPPASPSPAPPTITTA